jgi:hypothetical protein
LFGRTAPHTAYRRPDGGNYPPAGVSKKQNLLALLLLHCRIHERRIGCTHSGSTALSGYPHVHCGIRYRFREKRLHVNRGVRTRPLQRASSRLPELARKIGKMPGSISLPSVAPGACDRSGPVTRAGRSGTGVYTLTSGDFVTCAGVLPACTGRVRKWEWAGARRASVC